VAGNDLESRSYGKADSGNDRIPEADAVYVRVARANDQVSRRFVDREKQGENFGSDARMRLDFTGRRHGFRLRGWLHELAQEKGAKKTGMNLLDRRMGGIAKRRAERREIGFVGDPEVIEYLSDAPTGRVRLPIELRLGKTECQCREGLITIGKFCDEAVRPMGLNLFGGCVGHGETLEEE